jgi:HD-like signal output (HDOD) protein
MAQLRRVSALHSLRPRLETLWRHALTVAALAHILARRCRYVQPDEALLTGLLHVVGELYIYAHINRAPAALQEDNVLQCAVRDWHAATAKAILEAWGFAEHMTRAVEDHELLAREHTGSADITDVLTAANLIADYAGCPERLELSMQGVKAFDKLGFDGKQCKHMLQESAVEIAALQDVLDDADPIHRRTPSTPSAIRSG